MGAGPPQEVVELRIHGVGGSTVEQLVGADRLTSAKPLTIDVNKESGFWACPKTANSPELHAYLWGRYSVWTLGVWLVLLPFTLLNGAGWTVQSGRGSRSARAGAVVARWSIAALGLALTAGWTFWMAQVVGDRIAYSREWSEWSRVPLGFLGVGLLGAAYGVRTERTIHGVKPRGSTWAWATVGLTLVLIAVAGWGDAKWITAVSLAAAATATATPFVIAGTNRKRFEQYRARLGGTGLARERRRLSDEETLAAPCFYDHPTDSAALLLLHGVVAGSILGIIAVRAFSLSPDDGSFSSSLLDAPDAIGTPFLGHALLGIGALQAFLVAMLVIAGILGTTKDSAGRDPSKWNAVVNALRPASVAGIGVFLFTAAVGGIDAVLYHISRGPVGLAGLPEVELVPAFMVGAVFALLLTLISAAAYYLSNGPDSEEEAPLSLASGWKKWRTIRWVIANMDRFVVVTGLSIAACLLGAGLAHRWRGGLRWQLVPTRGFLGLEPAQFALWIIGGSVFFAPWIVAAVAGRFSVLRSPIGSMWDIVSFWPRRFHPLGVPPEAERTVPEVQTHLLQILDDDRRDARVQIVAHSQGSVITFAALAGLRDRDALNRISFISAGSPLFALYPRMFPAQISPHLTEELVGALGPERWVNLWRPTDYFGVPPNNLQSPPSQPVLHILQGDPPQILAHSKYFGRPDVEAEVVEQREKPLSSLPARRREPQASFAPRRRMVSWLDPRMLALTAYEAGVSVVFGKWADARRIEAVEYPTPDPIPLDLSTDDAWVDFVADMGDAFAPTFAVAAALAEPSLEFDGVVLERGQLLVMGGDQVYVTASLTRYTNQLIGPYTLASQCVDQPTAKPTLLAIPGNHDWFDGLRSFDELFCRRQPIGMWNTCQQRSYWAARLTNAPKGPTWWMWGVDLQLDNRLDTRQREYFKCVGDALEEGDYVILCSPIPTWAHARAEPTAFDELSSLVEDVIAPKKAHVVLHLSGDTHHYARFERQKLVKTETGEVEPAPWSEEDLLPMQHVTAGGGGAFTHPTHHLDHHVSLPVAYARDATTLTLINTGVDGQEMPHPTFGESRRLIAGNLNPWCFIRQNRSFLMLPGAVAAMAAYSASFQGAPIHAPVPNLNPVDVAQALVAGTVSIALIFLVIAGWTAFAKPVRGGSKVAARAVGFTHGIVQAAALCVTAWASLRITASLQEHAGDRIVAVIGMASAPAWLVGMLDRLTVVGTALLLGGVAGAMILGVYFVIANGWPKMHDNEAASAVASTDHKHFVRMHIQGERATAWVIHVSDIDQFAEPFSVHDPRPQLHKNSRSPKTSLWDCFHVGKDSKSGRA